MLPRGGSNHSDGAITILTRWLTELPVSSPGRTVSTAPMYRCDTSEEGESC